jgi:biopolymer transport protein ExbB
MIHYNHSQFRIGLFLVLVIGLVAAINATGSAQTTAPAAPAAAAQAPDTGVFSIILHNMDWVFWTIIGCSVIGLALIIQGFSQNREAVLLPATSTRRIRELIEQQRLTELIQFTGNDNSFVSRSLHPALKRIGRPGDMKEALETAAAEQTAEQFRRIEYLNIIGNLGPLLGLLGTVLGLIDAFSAMNAAGGDASPAALAGGISKALAHTLLGLLLAIPCLAAFGVLRTMVDRLTVRGSLLAEDLLLQAAREQPVTSDGAL